MADYSGGGGSGTGVGALLYDFTISGADATAIDTFVDNGGGGVGAALSSSYKRMSVSLYSRTDEATAQSGISVTANNDATGLYDIGRILNVNGTQTLTSLVSQSAWLLITAGTSDAAGVFGVWDIEIPNYTTTNAKQASAVLGLADSTIGQVQSGTYALNYRGALGLTRLAVTPTTGGRKLKVGTRLTIYGF